MMPNQTFGSVGAVPTRGGQRLAWQRWAPYAAVVWSLLYAGLGLYWAMGGPGFPFSTDAASDMMGPLIGRFGPGVVWIVVLVAGIPAAVMGLAMLGGVRGKVLRPLLLAAGILLAGVLLLLMTGLNLLVFVGYIPYAVLSLVRGSAIGQSYLEGWTQWATIHELLCLVGGFLWLAATLCYSRRSSNACVYCGRGEQSEGWQSPGEAARWGRFAVAVALVPPILYAFTRYAWALGLPLGMSQESLRRGQATGMWTSGLFLATFGLVGAVLMLGLVRRWGEIFPRWMIGLAGHRVPLALAVVPAALASVLLIVGGVAIWSSLGGMVTTLETGGVEGMELVLELLVQVGPTLLFPVWGAALAVATLGYYYRRRGPCAACGRGAVPPPTPRVTGVS